MSQSTYVACEHFNYVSKGTHQFKNNWEWHVRDCFG